MIVLGPVITDQCLSGPRWGLCSVDTAHRSVKAKVITRVNGGGVENILSCPLMKKRNVILPNFGSRSQPPCDPERLRFRGQAPSISCSLIDACAPDTWKGPGREAEDEPQTGSKDLEKAYLRKDLHLRS